MKIKLGGLPVIKQVIKLVGGIKLMVKIFGLATGKRTQTLLLVIGLLLSIVQPYVSTHYPDYADLLTKVVTALGIAAGITFSEKINRLIEAVGELFKK